VCCEILHQKISRLKNSQNRKQKQKNRRENQEVLRGGNQTVLRRENQTVPKKLFEGKIRKFFEVKIKKSFLGETYTFLHGENQTVLRWEKQKVLCGKPKKFSERKIKKFSVGGNQTVRGENQNLLGRWISNSSQGPVRETISWKGRNQSLPRKLLKNTIAATYFAEAYIWEPQPHHIWLWLDAASLWRKKNVSFFLRDEVLLVFYLRSGSPKSFGHLIARLVDFLLTSYWRLHVFLHFLIDVRTQIHTSYSKRQ